MQYVSALVLVANRHRELQTDHFPWNANPTWIRDPIESTKTTTLRETDIVPENGWLEDDRFLLGAPAYLPGFFCCSNSGRQFSTLNLRVFPGVFIQYSNGGKSVSPWFSRRRCQPQLLALLLWLQHHACQGVDKKHDGNLRIFIGISSTFFLGMQKKDNRNIHIMFEKISGVFEVWIIFGDFGYPQTSPPKSLSGIFCWCFEQTESLPSWFLFFFEAKIMVLPQN